MRGHHLPMDGKSFGKEVVLAAVFAAACIIAVGTIHAVETPVLIKEDVENWYGSTVVSSLAIIVSAFAFRFLFLAWRRFESWGMPGWYAFLPVMGIAGLSVSGLSAIAFAPVYCALVCGSTRYLTGGMGKPVLWRDLLMSAAILSKLVIVGAYWSGVDSVIVAWTYLLTSPAWVTISVLLLFLGMRDDARALQHRTLARKS